MVNSARPINELTGRKKPNSVLVRGDSALDIAKQAGLVPWSTDEVQFIEYLRGARGYSVYELWVQQPGNSAKTLEDFWEFLGLAQAVAITNIMNDILAAQTATVADVATTEENATLSDISRQQAQEWANYLAGEVVAGEGYSAKYWAQQAETVVASINVDTQFVVAAAILSF